VSEKSERGEARTLGMPGTEGGRHSLQVFNREQAIVQGVVAVESFDDVQIIMETDMGGLTIKGEDLHIKQLDLEKGRFAVEGFITSCVYAAPRQRGVRPARGRSFLERLLR
jgi:sporulation protein YabP